MRERAGRARTRSSGQRHAAIPGVRAAAVQGQNVTCTFTNHRKPAPDRHEGCRRRSAQSTFDLAVDGTKVLRRRQRREGPGEKNYLPGDSTASAEDRRGSSNVARSIAAIWDVGLTAVTGAPGMGRAKCVACLW